MQNNNKSQWINIIPRPVKLEFIPGQFIIDSSTAISTRSISDDTGGIARYLADALHVATGFRIPVISPAPSDKSLIMLELGAKEGEAGKPEGYRLIVTPGKITIAAAEPVGLFYGVQSLRQLLPPDFGADSPSSPRPITMPGVRIDDSPRFPWRGFMLDSARHYQHPDLIMKILDILALYKINRFHWHLVDNERWRLGLSQHPELTMPISSDSPYYDTEPVYAAKEIDKIVRFARERFITVYPEIEMPGHSHTAVCHHPEISCVKDPIGSFCLDYCPGNEATARFLKEVLDESFRLFPGPYVHLGGDEALKDTWQNCKRCRQKMTEEGLQDEHELQIHFMATMSRYVHARGRQSIAWAEHLELGIPAGQIVQGWHAGESAVAIKNGRQTLNSDHSYTYLDYSNASNDPASEWMPILPIERVYSFEPVPLETPDDRSSLVLGSEACLWTENTAEEDRLYIQIFPRLLAFAEVVWSARDLRDWNHFKPRMENHSRWLKSMDIVVYDSDRAWTKIGHWNSDAIGTERVTREWDATAVLNGHGTLEVEFLRDRGSDRLHVLWVALAENGKEIYRDTHEAYVWFTSRNNVFRLSLPQFSPSATYSLRACLYINKVNLAGRTRWGTGAQGSIWARHISV